MKSFFAWLNNHLLSDAPYSGPRDIEIIKRFGMPHRRIGLVEKLFNWARLPTPKVLLRKV